MDNVIKEGKIVFMIVVILDVNFGNRYISYFNDFDNNFNFEDFFF